MTGRRGTITTEARSGQALAAVAGRLERRVRQHCSHAHSRNVQVSAPSNLRTTTDRRIAGSKLRRLTPCF